MGQTLLPYCLISQYTMAKKGTKLYAIYVKETRKVLGLRCVKEWLLIAFYDEDVIRGQWIRVKQIIEKSNGKMVLIPANMTHIFQPLDLTVNGSSKAFLHSHAQDWYSNKILKQTEKGIAPHKVHQ